VVTLESYAVGDDAQLLADQWIAVRRGSRSSRSRCNRREGCRSGGGCDVGEAEEVDGEEGVTRDGYLCGWEGSGALLKAEDMSVDSWKIYSSVIPDLRNCSYRKTLRTDVD
jgi:hypothetical protein